MATSLCVPFPGTTGKGVPGEVKRLVKVIPERGGASEDAGVFDLRPL